MQVSAPPVDPSPLVATGSSVLQPPERTTTLPGLLHGLTYQTPTIGAIRIGITAEKDGEIVPVPDDEFTVTTRFRDAAGNWIDHAIAKTLKDETQNLVNAKLRRIPVKVIYDNPNLNMSEQYTAFTTDQRPSCVGNGVLAKRAGMNGTIESVECLGPDLCAYGREPAHPCATLARAVFQIEGQEGCESAFIFRTSSYNSVNDMRVRLQSLQAGFGGKMAGLPMWLEMHLKSTALSGGQAFFYVSLEPRFDSYPDAAKLVNERAKAETEAGFDRKAFEDSMVAMLANGNFTENFADVPEFVDLLAGRGKAGRAQVDKMPLENVGGFDVRQYAKQYQLKAPAKEAVTETGH